MKNERTSNLKGIIPFLEAERHLTDQNMQVLSWPALSTITAALEHRLIDLDICDNVKESGIEHSLLSKGGRGCFWL